MYQLAEETIKARGIAQDGDEVLALLQQTVVNEDEYLRYRIPERFNALMKKLFDRNRMKCPAREARFREAKIQSA
jgi:hypothetical protein